MKAFWWFKDDSVAGMARPGCNSYQWFDLSFEEAVLMSWLGQHSSGEVPISTFVDHLNNYVPKVASFYDLSEQDLPAQIKKFQSKDWIYKTSDRVKKRTNFIDQLEISDNVIRFESNQDQLLKEIEFLSSQKIKHVVTLTEDHHNKEVLEDNFILHHLSIEDMGAPTFKQVEQLADILSSAESKKEKVVVHCLAGIGRTSTMLIAASILRGQNLPELLDHLKSRNPAFQFAGSQARFIKKLGNQS